jgi:hypothetical protein
LCIVNVIIFVAVVLYIVKIGGIKMNDIGFATGLIVLYFLYKIVMWILKKEYEEELKDHYWDWI